MRRPLSQTLFAWLCLIGFGLCGAFVQSGVTVCSDGHGGSRLEWGCDRNDDGECVTSCGESSASDERHEGMPHPCDDRPLKQDQTFAQRGVRQIELPGPTAPVAIPDWFWSGTPAPVARRLPPPRAHPPDTVAVLRCVILVI